MIHIINKLLIIVICILIYFKLCVKEGFRLNKYKNVPVPDVKKLGHLPENIVEWIGEQIGAPANPHNPDYRDGDDDGEETCPS